MKLLVFSSSLSRRDAKLSGHYNLAHLCKARLETGRFGWVPSRIPDPDRRGSDPLQGRLFGDGYERVSQAGEREGSIRRSQVAQPGVF